MSTSFIDVIGTVAGTLTTLSFLPQVIKTWRSQSTHDISLIMFISFNLGVVLWLVYGFLMEAWPIVISNLVTLIFSGIILTMKIRDVLRGQDCTD